MHESIFLFAHSAKKYTNKDSPRRNVADIMYYNENDSFYFRESQSNQTIRVCNANVTGRKNGLACPRMYCMKSNPSRCGPVVNGNVEITCHMRDIVRVPYNGCDFVRAKTCVKLRNKIYCTALDT